MLLTFCIVVDKFADLDVSGCFTFLWDTVSTPFCNFRFTSLGYGYQKKCHFPIKNESTLDDFGVPIDFDMMFVPG